MSVSLHEYAFVVVFMENPLGMLSGMMQCVLRVLYALRMLHAGSASRGDAGFYAYDAKLVMHVFVFVK